MSNIHHASHETTHAAERESVATWDCHVLGHHFHPFPMVLSFPFHGFFSWNTRVITHPRPFFECDLGRSRLQYAGDLALLFSVPGASADLNSPVFWGYQIYLSIGVVQKWRTTLVQCIPQGFFKALDMEKKDDAGILGHQK